LLRYIEETWPLTSILNKAYVKDLLRWIKINIQTTNLKFK